MPGHVPGAKCPLATPASGRLLTSGGFCTANYHPHRRPKTAIPHWGHKTAPSVFSALRGQTHARACAGHQTPLGNASFRWPAARRGLLHGQASIIAPAIPHWGHKTAPSALSALRGQTHARACAGHQTPLGNASFRQATDRPGLPAGYYPSPLRIWKA